MELLLKFYQSEVEHMKSKVVEAEAQVPMALAEALRNGNLGVMDYYRMQNIQSDTNMKNNIGTTDIGKMFKSQNDPTTKS